MVESQRLGFRGREVVEGKNCCWNEDDHKGTTMIRVAPNGRDQSVLEHRIDVCSGYGTCWMLGTPETASPWPFGGPPILGLVA